MMRPSPDWGRLDRSYLKESEAFDWKFSRPERFIAGLIELWDSTFDTSFYEVRQAVKDVTLESFAAVRGARIVLAEEPEPSPPPDLALFSDDDDWFAPDIVDYLRRPAAENDGLTWTSVLFNGLLRERDAMPTYCWSNNYAVTRRFIESNQDWRAQVGGQHSAATAAFHSEGFETVHVAVPLSIANKHPCSITWLKNALTLRPGRDGLVALVDDFNSRAALVRLPPELRWAEPQIATTTALFAGLGVRKRSI